MVKTEDSTEERQYEIFGDGGEPIVNVAKNPVLPFIKTSKYQITDYIPIQSAAGSVRTAATKRAEGVKSALSNEFKSEKSSKPIKGKELPKIASKEKDVTHTEEDDEMNIFQPLEQIIENGVFIDSNMRSKITVKPIVRYNPLKDMRATMGVTTWESSKIIDEGGDYQMGASMTR